jgi:hypothetical protein
LVKQFGIEFIGSSWLIMGIIFESFFKFAYE